MKKVSVPVASIVLVAMMALPAQANHSWGGYHWSRATNPVALTLVNSVTSDWDGYVDVARKDWDKSTVLDLAAVEQGSETAKDRKRCTPVAGKYRVCNQSYGFNGWLGIASIWLTSGTTHIAQATTKLNDSYFGTSTYNKPEWKQMVACQEIGHDYGLDHQDENFDNANLGTCMDYTNSPLGPPDNTHPNQHDYDELLTIYNHLDSAQPAPPGPGHGNHYGRYTRESGDYTIVTWVLYTS